MPSLVQPLSFGVASWGRLCENTNSTFFCRVAIEHGFYKIHFTNILDESLDGYTKFSTKIDNSLDSGIPVLRSSEIIFDFNIIMSASADKI